MWVQQVAVNWLVYDLTSSAAVLALVNGCRTIAWAVMAPATGLLVDRFDRKGLLVLIQVGMALAAVLFAVDVALGTVVVWHIMVFSFLVGTGNAFNNTTRRTILPNLVPTPNIVQANALANASMNITRAIGPAVGGVLIQAVGMVFNFVLQAGCYAVSFLCTLPIRAPRGSGDVRAHGSPLRSLADGYAYVTQDRRVRSVLILSLVGTMFVFPIQPLIPVFARDILHQGADGYGVLLMAYGIGSLVGTLLLASAADTERKAPLLLVLMLLAVGSPILFAWSGSFVLALLVLAVQGASQMALFSLIQGMMQLMVPNALLGRVMSVDNLNSAMIPLGGIVGGILADAIGAPMAVTVLCGAGLATVVVVFGRLAEVRQL
jgi:predicted MFS family arabinose efflux permease